MKLHEGYVMVDHRASPGTAEVPEGQLLEAATMHCAHCNTVVILNPARTRSRESCYACAAYICDNCAIEMKQPNYIHNPFNKRIDDLLRKFSNNG